LRASLICSSKLIDIFIHPVHQCNVASLDQPSHTHWIVYTHTYSLFSRLSRIPITLVNCRKLYIQIHHHYHTTHIAFHLSRALPLANFKKWVTQTTVSGQTFLDYM
jgi:hypothetical protein